MRETWLSFFKLSTSPNAVSEAGGVRETGSCLRHDAVSAAFRSVPTERQVFIFIFGLMIGGLRGLWIRGPFCFELDQSVSCEQVERALHIPLFYHIRPVV